MLLLSGSSAPRSFVQGVSHFDLAIPLSIQITYMYKFVMICDLHSNSLTRPWDFTFLEGFMLSIATQRDSEVFDLPLISQSTEDNQETSPMGYERRHEMMEGRQGDTLAETSALVSIIFLFLKVV